MNKVQTSYKEYMESLTFNERLEYIKSKLSEFPLVNDVWLIKQVGRIPDLEQRIKRYRELINNINEKASVFGVNEQVYGIIQEAVKELEGKK